MSWQEPIVSREDVNRAGRTLVDGDASPDELDLALTLVGAWRSSHAFPLNTMQMALRQRAWRIDPSALVVQRLKRLASIIAKLERFENMKVSQIQDIGGCRAVVSSVRRVYALRRLYFPRYRKHELAREKDYIAEPKSDGYRSIHLVYRYHSGAKAAWNGLQTEIQLRSRLQHAWATAVETAGTLLRQPLKSGGGEDEWREFFTLVSSGFALRERQSLVPGTPSDRAELQRRIRDLLKSLDAERRLRTFGRALREIDIRDVRRGFCLVVLRPAEERVSVTSYPDAGQREQAMANYMQVEKDIRTEPGSDAVLVAAESALALRHAYPNYFLDTHVFLKSVRTFLDS